MLRHVVTVYETATTDRSHIKKEFEQESRVDATKPRDVAAVLFGLKFVDNIHYKFKSSRLRKPGFRAPNVPAHNRI